MQTSPVTTQQLKSSVIAVPPLSRDDQYEISVHSNRQIVEHIEGGGVSILLYGGNANLYHVRLSEYGRLLQMFEEISGEQTLVIPSVGPSYGMMMDQAALLREQAFPTAMVLPQEGVMTEAGMMTAFRRFVESVGKPAVLYIKREGFISPENTAKLVDDSLVSFIKYAIVRDDPRQDDFLTELVDRVDKKWIVSGIGEQPAIVHLKQFGITGFTSGCVCIAPSLSQEMLAALYQDDLEQAERIRQTFKPLEDLRNRYSPIRVLHEAVALSGIAETGPQLPMMSDLDQQQRAEVAGVAQALLEKQMQVRSR
jgi:dihydrodipicolinate synthase/N-acetylneuraminate lyase